MHESHIKNSKEPAASFAGPEKYVRPLAPPKEPITTIVGTTGAAKYLIKRGRFHGAPKVLSCLSLAGWTPDEAAPLRYAILKSIRACPSAYVDGEQRAWDSIPEGIDFLRVSGFDEATIAILLNLRPEEPDASP